MNICVVGAGAIGGWIAARLALAGNDVSVVARGDTLQAIDSEGLLITDRGDTRCVAVATATEPSSFGVHDVVVLAVKAPTLPQIAPGLEGLIGPETQIVPMLNGVPWWFIGRSIVVGGSRGRIADVLPIEQVAGSVVHASCYRSAPNHVIVKQADRLILGEPDGGASERIEKLCTLFENSGIRCDASDEYSPGNLVQIVGKRDPQPIIRADPVNSRQASRR